METEATTDSSKVQYIADVLDLLNPIGTFIALLVIVALAVVMCRTRKKIWKWICGGSIGILVIYFFVPYIYFYVMWIIVERFHLIGWVKIIEPYLSVRQLGKS